MGSMDNIDEIASQEVEVGVLQTLITFAILGIFIFLLIKIVKSLLNRLEPSAIDYMDIDDIETEYSHIEERENLDLLSYMPLAIVSVMFFIFNYIFIFVK